MTDSEDEQTDSEVLRLPGTELRRTGRPHEVEGFLTISEWGTPEDVENIEGQTAVDKDRRNSDSESTPEH
jgi:hypothetical protein